MKFILFAFICISPSAFALIAGIPPDTPEKRIVKNTCLSPESATVSIQIHQGIYSGIIVGKSWVLTAAHVAEGVKNKPSTLIVNIPCTHQKIASKKIIIHTKYHHQKADNINLYDLALVELSKPVPENIHPISVNFSIIPQGMTALFMGYGASGTPLSSKLVGSKTDVLRSGKNNLDGLVSDQTKQQFAFLYDFDGPDKTTNMMGQGTLGNDIETEVAPGDSGSPIFGKNIKNEWSLVGISTFRMGFGNPTKQMPQPPAFGSGGGGIILNSSALWILKIVPDLKIDWTPLQP